MNLNITRLPLTFIYLVLTFLIVLLYTNDQHKFEFFKGAILEKLLHHCHVMNHVQFLEEFWIFVVGYEVLLIGLYPIAIFVDRFMTLSSDSNFNILGRKGTTWNQLIYNPE